jgi:hypothetical protein
MRRGNFTHPPPITEPKSVSPGLQQRIKTHTGVGVDDVQVYPNSRVLNDASAGLPPLDAGFGRQDVSSVRAYHNAAQANGPSEIGAKAYTSGSAVSFSQGNQIFLAPGQGAWYTSWPISFSSEAEASQARKSEGWTLPQSSPTRDRVRASRVRCCSNLRLPADRVGTVSMMVQTGHACGVQLSLWAAFRARPSACSTRKSSCYREERSTLRPRTRCRSRSGRPLASAC